MQGNDQGLQWNHQDSVVWGVCVHQEPVEMCADVELYFVYVLINIRVEFFLWKLLHCLVHGNGYL